MAYENAARTMSYNAGHDTSYNMRMSSFNKESSAYDFSAYYDYSSSTDNAANGKRYPFELFDKPVTSGGRTGRPTRTSINGAVRRTTDSRRAPVSRSKAQSAAQTAAKRKISTELIVRIAAVGAVAVFVLTMLIISQVHSHELTRSIQVKQRELETLRQNYEIMMDEFATEMSDSSVEEYAINNFGMQRCENSQTEYISLDSEEHFEFGAETRSTWTARNEG